MGIFKTKSFSIPIICIGNLNAGGSGKTPHTDYIFKVLANKKVAIISRGYKRKSNNLYNVEIDSDCLLYTSPSPRDGLLSRMPSSA